MVRPGREPLVYDVCAVVLCAGRAPAALPDGQLRGYAELVPEASAGAGSQPAGAPGYHYLQFRTHGDCGECSRRDHHCHRGQYFCRRVREPIQRRRSLPADQEEGAGNGIYQGI